LIRHGLISETQMDKAMEEVRDNKERIESILMNKYNISKDNIGKALEDYHNCKFVTFDDKLPIPGDLLKNLKKPFLKRELWVPLSKSEGKINVIVDDPSDIIKKDTIEGLLKTKFVRYDVALAEDINQYIERFYSSPEDYASIDELLGKLETDDEPAEEDSGEMITETHSIIMQLVNKIINEAYSVAHPIFISNQIPIRKMSKFVTALMVNVQFNQTLPYNYRAALVSRIKIMCNLDITVRRMPQDGKIKFKRSGGDELELRVAHNTYSGRCGRCCYASAG